MGTVTIRNYSFPIDFSHKGWKIHITNETGLFSMKDLKVKVRMQVDYEKISMNIAQALEQVESLRRRASGFGSNSFRTYVSSPQMDKNFFTAEYNRILILAKEFANRKGTTEYTLGINGGMLDRFFGQNISAVEKMCQLVIDNIDRNYGDVQSEFLKTLK